MIKKFILIIAMCTILLLSGCDYIFQLAPTATPVQETAQVLETTPVPLATQEPQETLSVQIQETAIVTQVPINTVNPQLTMPPQSDPSPPNTMEFYSCYAFMESYNPATGWAEFDYFYMHKGQDAIDYLVDHEGYTLADAQNEVNDYADGEFVCENNNPGLRTIDLDLVPIKLMFNPDGTMVSDAQSIPANSADVTNLYNMNPDYLFDYFFFYIHCDEDGNILLVEQIYWC